MYFPLLSLHGWGERLGEGRRHNCAVMPYINIFVKGQGLLQFFFEKKLLLDCACCILLLDVNKKPPYKAKLSIMDA